MKPLPVLLASLTLVTGFVSCTGPMPIGPAGAHLGLYAPTPAAPLHGFTSSTVATPTRSLAGSLPSRSLLSGTSSVATPTRSLAGSLPVRAALAETPWLAQLAVARPAVPLRSRPDLVAVGGSDYQPHLAREYRNGWQAGINDATIGATRDYRRSYACYGSGWESYFQEGYADGYEGRPMAH